MMRENFTGGSSMVWKSLSNEMNSVTKQREISLNRQTIPDSTLNPPAKFSFTETQNLQFKTDETERFIDQ